MFSVNENRGITRVHINETDNKIRSQPISGGIFGIQGNINQSDSSDYYVRFENTPSNSHGVRQGYVTSQRERQNVEIRAPCSRYNNDNDQFDRQDGSKNSYFEQGNMIPMSQFNQYQ